MENRSPVAVALLSSFLVVGAALVHPAAAQVRPLTAPESVGMSLERLEHLDARIRHYLEADQIAGAVALVARDGKVVHLESYGYRDREAGDPMEIDDMFVIMSMTKPIVSTALMILYEEGKFVLTDPISDWLPEYATMKVAVEDGQGGGRLADARPITIRHALTHTTGISTGRGAPSMPPATEHFEGALASDATEPRAGESALRARVREMATTPLNFQPGERWPLTSSAASRASPPPRPTTSGSPRW